MGNVFDKSKSSETLFESSMPPPPPTLTPEYKEETKIENPGPMEDLHKKTKGSVDSNWNVAAVLEKKLLPLPVTFTLSGLLSHRKDCFKLGVGFVIG